MFDMPPNQTLPTRLELWNTPTAPLQRGKAARNECFDYGSYQSDGEVPVMRELWGMWSTPFIAIASRSTLTQSGSTIYELNRTKLRTYK